jgi:hypothetical protein
MQTDHVATILAVNAMAIAGKQVASAVHKTMRVRVSPGLSCMLMKST